MTLREGRQGRQAPSKKSEGKTKGTMEVMKPVTLLQDYKREKRRPFKATRINNCLGSFLRKKLDVEDDTTVNPKEVAKRVGKYAWGLCVGKNRATSRGKKKPHRSREVLIWPR